MATIFDLVTADSVTAYWEQKIQGMPPYLGDELFPADQKLGLDLKWIKGAKGLPVVLNASSYDAVAKKRDRIGFQQMYAQMPYFKESMDINEELRQQLNIMMQTGNQEFIDSIMSKIFDDNMTLLEAAKAQRERIRMMALTTGAISIASNGQAYDYDYGVPANHKVTAAKSWSDPTADIITEVKEWLDLVEDETGIRPSRAICSRKTFGYLRKNTDIKNAILANNSAAPVSDSKIMQYLLDELELKVVVYTKKCKLENGSESAFVPDDVFVAFPEGALGTGWFGTTPAQSDLMTSKVANVSITDTGVAVTTTEKVDPVTVEEIVSMIYLPSFEAADQIIIADVIK